MAVKLFILFFLLISIIKVHGEHFKIDVLQEGSIEKNKLTLVKGRFSKIFIKFISDLETDITTQTTTIHFSDNEKFKLTEDNISIDTSKLRGVQTSIGIPCSAQFSEDELANGVIAKFNSDNTENFISYDIIISIKEEESTIKIEYSADTIPFKGVGGFFISSELRNVDQIIISHNFDEKFKNDFEIEGSEIDLLPNNEKFGHYNKITKYYSKTDNNIDGIEIQFTLKDEETISKCYKIENPAIKIKVSNTESISDTNNKKFPLIGSSYQREMWITSISSMLVPSFIDCVVISEGHEFPTNEQILANEPIESIPSSELKYIKQVIGPKHSNINFVSTTFNRLKEYKYKCIYQNNAYESSAKTSYEFIGDNRINYLRTNTVMPICLDFYFSSLENQDEFDLKISNYFRNSLLNPGNKTDFFSIKFSMRNIKDYYNDNTNILKSICGYIDGVSPEEITIDLKTKIKGISSKINNTLSSIQVNGKLEKTELISYTNLESYSLNLEVYEHSKDSLKLHIESKETTNNIVCDYLVTDESDKYKLSFNEKQRLIFDKSEKKEKLEFKFPSDKGFDQKKYYLVFKCNPLVGLDYLSSVIYTHRFIHSQENSFDCLTNLKSPQCVDINAKKKIFTDLPKMNIISNLATSIAKYEKGTFKDKSDILRSQSIFIAHASPKPATLQNFYQFLIFLQNYNCNYDDSYSTCRETKKKYQESVSPVFEKLFFTNDTLIEFYDSVKSNTTCVEYITMSFYILFLEGNNGDSFNKNSLNVFLKVYQKFVNEYSSVLGYMDERYKENDKYKKPIQNLFTLIIDNMQNIFTHMEADNLFNNKDITEDSKGSYVMQDEALRQYKKLFTSTLAPYYIKNNIKEETFENFKFYYRPLETITLRNLETVVEQAYSFGNIKVTIPINTLISEENIKGLVFYVYDRYPLLSMLSSKNYSQIITIRRYNQNNTITDEDISLFQSSSNTIKVSYYTKTLDESIANCLYFLNGNITNENIFTSVNSEDQTITCSANFLADIGLGNIIIPSSKGLSWWMILLICILCGGVLACLGYLGYSCFCSKKNNDNFNDLEKQGKILNDFSESQSNSK